MKISREKKIREEYVKGVEERVVEKIARAVMGEERIEGKRKSNRNICLETGRSRGVVKEYRISRYRYRAKADKGEIEGVRRGSW
jgi:ribosomal protein S14